MKRRVIRQAAALALAAAALWAVSATVGRATLAEAVAGLRGGWAAQQALRWQLGDYAPPRDLSWDAFLALVQAPLLLYPPPAAEPEAPAPDEPPAEDALVPQPVEEPPTEEPEEPAPEVPAPEVPAPDDAAEGDMAAGLSFTDNGMPSETVDPALAGNYAAAGGVMIRNRSDRDLEGIDLDSGAFAATYAEAGPQVLILHTHGSEAYTLPPGQTYHSTGSYRSDDASVGVVRVGDEIADVLSSYGISVLHDRNLYDDPAYNGAYERSGAAAEAYLAQYPSITFILDVHRDAVADTDGNQYKLLCAEDPRAAQVSFIMGVNHEGWEENLKLACAVQRTLAAEMPTLMRPISLLNANYNQNLSRGSMLVEVGAAGNSPEEAVYAARLFARGLAKTILPEEDAP